MQNIGRAAAAALAILFGLTGITAASQAADLMMIAESGTSDASETQWIALRPASEQPFTFWSDGLSGVEINWDLPSGATLGETVWPPAHLLRAGEEPILAFAGDALILQEIELSEGATASAIAATMVYSTCAPVTGSCVTSEAGGQARLGAQTGDTDLFAAAREVAAPFRRSGVMTRAGGGQFHIGVNKNANDDGDVERGFFLPFTGGLLAANGAMELDGFETGFFSSVEAGPAVATNPEMETGKIGGLLVLLKSGASDVETYLLSEPNDYSRSLSAEKPVAYGGDLTLVSAILFALLGGVILNLMPCVFPVLAMKVFALVRAAGESQKALRTDALAYTIGVLVSFLVLAGVLITIRSLGQQVGWGFQLQSPAFIFVIAVVLFLVGLNLLGAFQVGGALQNLGGKLAMREGPAGAFMTGVLATIVATPCTVPFMAPAIAYALTQSAVASVSVFAALGLGLALPYLLISYIPAIQQRFPAPGPWMVRMKEFLAFPMFATVVWLVWILETQSGEMGVIVVLSALVLTGMGIWLVGQLKTSGTALRRGVAAVIIAAVLAPAALPNALPKIPRTGVQTQFSPDIGIHSEVYSEARLRELRTEGRPVFLHFWASWCIICVMHENLVFSTDEFQAFLRNNNVVFMEIDNTLEVPETMMLMESFGRSGQPLDIFFPGSSGAPAYVLPELFTTDKVLGVMTPLL